MPGCGWRGKRVSAGGPCGVEGCDGVVEEAPRNAPRLPQGPRVKMTIRVAPPTAEALTAREIADMADGVAARRDERHG